jgi:hypothetical protein
LRCDALEDGGEQIDARQQVLEVVETEQHVQLAQLTQQVSGQIRLPSEIEVLALASAETIWLGVLTEASATNATPSANAVV